MLNRIKLKNVIWILVGILMFTPAVLLLWYTLAMALVILGMAAKVVGAILIGYNAYHVFIQIKNNEEDEVVDED